METLQLDLTKPARGFQQTRNETGTSIASGILAKFERAGHNVYALKNGMLAKGGGTIVIFICSISNPIPTIKEKGAEQAERACLMAVQLHSEQTKRQKQERRGDEITPAL